MGSGRIILLNGASSSGRTSLARHVQTREVARALVDAWTRRHPPSALFRR